MGGSSKKKSSEPEDKNTINAAIRPMREVPAAMPGQLDALSQQLAMGYNAEPADLLSLMNQYYQPMMLPDYGLNAVPGAGAGSSDGNSNAGSIIDQLGRGSSEGVKVPSSMGWMTRRI